MQMTQKQSEAPKKKRAPDPRAQVSVRLSKDDCAALDRLASDLAISRSKFVQLMLGAKLNNAPRLSRDEVNAVLAGNRELLSIGRNLNQIAAKLNRSPLETDQARGVEIQALTKMIQAHVDLLYSLANGALKRWQ